jgi:hypothetical protein
MKKNTPPELDKIVDVVLSYRPKPKKKKKRAKKNLKGSQLYNSHKKDAQRKHPLLHGSLHK